ncbi:LacI family DNA-binding transcriptional regulator [Microbacterium sp. NPDC079995]|uniref:LacI family DNA-binding transcriptional regulator n=1 Tax=unclassified Microbacterium TaxID=2609290 RepID=UPI00344F682C
MGRITSRDVAKAAGVSQTTVSFALRDDHEQRISPETRRRVRDTAAQLGYTPSQAARALKLGRTDTVLLVFPHVTLGPVAAKMLDGLTSRLEAIGLSLISRTEIPGETFSALWTGLNPVAVITATPPTSAELEDMTEAGVIPIALVDERWNERAGIAQVQHLTSRGHRVIAYAMPQNPGEAKLAGQRLAGVQEACRNAGLASPEVQQIGLDAVDAVQAIEHWRALESPVTAVCAYNDEYAFAVLAGMRHLGLRAPADLAVIGVDNLEISPLADPPLTTVDVGGDALDETIDRIIETILAGHQKPGARTALRLQIVERESV